MEYVLMWGVFIAAAVSVAKSKGRNLFLWGALGACIGPFAVLILAFLKTTDQGDKSYR